MTERRGLSLDSAWIYLQAAAIGLFGGWLGVAFRLGIDWLQVRLMGKGAPVDVRLAPYESVLFPILGALLAAACLRAIGNRRGPFGISDTVELAATRRGNVSVKDSLFQIVSSGFTIASGGSIGREGANSQFGVTIAAVLGRLVPNSPRSRTVLLGCGIAAGMASAYKAPIAAALFVMEVVLGNFAMDVLAPIVVASVVSTLVTRAAFSDDPLYDLGIGGQLELTDWRLVLSAAVLGAMCGVGGIVFRRCLELGRRLFDRLRGPLVLRMVLGAAFVGVIGIWFPEVWGNGQETIEVLAAPEHQPTLFVLVTLTVLKIASTAITAGSGALGGVFTPNLVVGAALGAAFAKVTDTLVPGDHHTHFALVGMAGLCAATAHAPITAILLVFEMTRDYGLILPLMLCSILASITARLIDQDSIYTARLRARGHGVDHGLEELAMHTNYVRDVMRRDAASVRETTTLDEVLDVFGSKRHDTLYVVDAKGSLLGQVLLHDVKAFINDPTPGTVVIAADLTTNTEVTTRDESLAAILDRFHDPDLDELPVVRSRTDPILEGRITRRDVVATFSEEVLGQRNMRAKLRVDGKKESRWLELPPGARIERLRVPPELIDRSLGSLDLPVQRSATVLVVIETDALGRERRSFPSAEMILRDGMELVVLAPQEVLRAWSASTIATKPGDDAAVSPAP
jgi:CIC family chloride channel protein